MRLRRQAMWTTGPVAKRRRGQGENSWRSSDLGARSLDSCYLDGTGVGNFRVSDSPNVVDAEVLRTSMLDSVASSSALRVTRGNAALAALAEDGADGTVKVEPKPVKPRSVTLLSSVFEGRPPVVFFTYTDACGAKQRPLDRGFPADESSEHKLYYCHTDAVEQYNAVLNTVVLGGLYRININSLRKRGALLWSSHPPPELLRALTPWQKANHFPGSWHLGRKDMLWRSVHRMQQHFGKSFAVMPQGFVFPEDSSNWNAARDQDPDALWIWKPCSQSCGRGIKVLSSSVPKLTARDIGRRRGVIQRYVGRPLLIDGYKFDLRIYVVVLSFDPLKVYICEDGLVRLATEKYSADPKTLGTQTMHLTNYSVNKLSSSFIQNSDKQETGPASCERQSSGDEENLDPSSASKWSLKHLRAHFEKQRLDYDATFKSVEDLVIKTLIAVEPQMRKTWCCAFGQPDGDWQSAPRGSGANAASCFEMYGFDVILDDVLAPWLLEVNICPSLSSGSPLDKRIKTKLVADTLTLVGISAPRQFWADTEAGRSGLKQQSSDTEDCGAPHKTVEGTAISPAALASRTSSLASRAGPEAVALFDAHAWDIVMQSHEEDMRSGGLKRIFPCADGAKYSQYFAKSVAPDGDVSFEAGETYSNVVLRKWHEAGGSALFRRLRKGQPVLPSWLPRLVSLERT